MEQFSKQSGCLCGPFYEEVLMSSYAVPHYSRRWVLLRGQYCSITYNLSSLVFVERLCWAGVEMFLAGWMTLGIGIFIIVVIDGQYLVW